MKHHYPRHRTQRELDIQTADNAVLWCALARAEDRNRDFHDEALRALRFYVRAGLGGMADMAADVVVAARQILEYSEDPPR